MIKTTKKKKKKPTKKTREVGRPLIFKTPEDMQIIIDKYFDKCKPELSEDNKGKAILNNKGFPIYKVNPPTITGLAIALGFNSRGTIYEYEKKNDEFSDTIKRARLRCENWVETELLSNNLQPASGIFALKNYGWKDTHELTGKDGDGIFKEAIQSVNDLFNKIHAKTDTPAN